MIYLLFIIVIVIVVIVSSISDSKNKRNQEIAQIESKKRECLAVVDMCEAISSYCPECGIVAFGEKAHSEECPICGGQMFTLEEKPICISAEPVRTGDLDDEQFSTLLELNSLYAKGEFNEVIVRALPLIEHGCPFAETLTGISYKELGKIKEYIEMCSSASEKKEAQAALLLAYEYEQGEVVERNNVLARKYYLSAVNAGSYKAIYGFTKLCEDNGFAWTEEIKDAKAGYRKAAVHGVEEAIKILTMASYSETIESIYEGIKYIKYRLFWSYAMVSIMQEKELEYNWVAVYRQELEELCHCLEAYVNISTEAANCYVKFKKELNKYSEIEYELSFRTEECFKGAQYEKEGDYEQALEMYRIASEKGDDKAIEAYRRLTGNESYMLKTGNMYDADYRKTYERARGYFENKDYEQFLIQARKTLEIYVHNFMWHQKCDFPEKTDLSQLIQTLKNRALISEAKYKAMDTVRRAGNRAVHSEQEVDEEFANKVMKALNIVLDL